MTNDPRTAEYASLADPELAHRCGLFVAEGRLVVRRVIEDGRYALRSLLLTAAAQQQLGAVLARLDPAVPCMSVRFSRSVSSPGSTSIAAASHL